MLDLSLLRPEQPRRIARAEFDRMVGIGLFQDERVELIHGVIVAMSPNDPPHASPVHRMGKVLTLALGDRAEVRVQLPLVAVDDSEPEPDIAVVPPGDYDEVHPERAWLVVEVADSSLQKDRLVKAPLYAASGFEEYWLVNVQERVVEVHRGASAEGWSDVTRHARGSTLSPIHFPDVVVRVADILR